MNELHALLSDLAETESELAIRTAERDELRNRISVLVESHGGKVAIPGLARAEIRSPSVVTTYDKKALAALCQSLRETDQAEMAAEIEGCQALSARAGGLVIVMERKAR